MKGNMTNMNINKTELVAIARETETSKAFFKELAKRERDRDSTNVRRLSARLISLGYSINPKDLTAMFIKLEKLGKGSLVVSSRGKPLLFKWNFSIKKIAAVAEADTIEFGNTAKINTQQERPMIQPIETKNNIIIMVPAGNGLDIDYLLKMINNQQR